MSRSPSGLIHRMLALPFRIGMHGMDGVVSRSGIAALPWLALGLLASWWVYVPLHELFHAWGCQFSGGTVSRLEIDPMYGATWLAGFFPDITPGSEYAGRLSGFDTGGSDAVYLCTVYFPYLLTVFVGVPALALAAQRRCAVCFGAAMPWAYTPFLSLTGDFYEIGSILVSRLAASWLPDAVERWRGDDLFLLVGNLYGPAIGGNWADTMGIFLALMAGSIAAFLTFALGYRLYAFWQADPHFLPAGEHRHVLDPHSD